MIKSVLNTYAFNLTYARMLVADLDAPQMTLQPKPGMNHPAWVLGHLALSSDFACNMLGLEPKLPNDWNEKFGMGSKPTAGGDYPDKDTLLSSLDEAHQRLATALEAADSATLDSQTPNEEFRRVMPTIGDGLVFLATGHECAHLGQLSAWRRASGLPSVF